MKKLFLLILILGFASAAFAQQRINGQVIDSKTGEPIIGATVVLKSNPSTGTATDFDGNFTIIAPSLNETLKVTYIGYSPLRRKQNLKCSSVLRKTPSFSMK